MDCIHCQFNKSINIWTIKVFLQLRVFSAYQCDSFEILLQTFGQRRMVLRLNYHMKNSSASEQYVS